MAGKNEKLRVAMLGHKRIPTRAGGVEIVVEELATRMVERGIDVTCYNRKGVLSASGDSDEDMPENYKGIKLKPVFTVNKRGLAALTSAVAATIRAAFGKYDVVHFHTEGPCIILWLAKLLGKRCIVTVHGLDHQRAKWGKLARTTIMLGEKNAAKFADEVIVLSRNVQQYFRDTYSRETRFIPNAVNRPIYREPELIREKFGLEKDGYILFLGRLVPEKGLKYLIEAFKRVETDKKLVIAGNPSDTASFAEELHELAAADERIIFTGFVKDRLLDELYGNAYIYTLPSDLEGMPLSLLEALSYGNCCVTSDIPECAEVVEDKAVTFRKGDADDLRDKLQALCDDPKTVAKYKTDAADFVCGKYKWENIVDETVKLYEGI